MFGRKIHELPLESVKVGPDQDYMFEIPSFVVTCCQKIISNVETEGLFRKAGSAKRQKEAKACYLVKKKIGISIFYLSFIS